MNFSKRNKSIVDFLFIMALFGAFAITGLFVVLFGAKVYKSTVLKMDENYSSRTALAYVTEKVRSHDYASIDKEDYIEVMNIDGRDVLLLKEEINDKMYITYMYMDDGYLMEMTVSEDFDFNFIGGTRILGVKDFEVKKVSDSLYDFTIVDEFDNKTQFYTAIYSNSVMRNDNE